MKIWWTLGSKLTCHLFSNKTHRFHHHSHPHAMFQLFLRSLPDMPPPPSTSPTWGQWVPPTHHQSHFFIIFNAFYRPFSSWSWSWSTTPIMMLVTMTMFRLAPWPSYYPHVGHHDHDHDNAQACSPCANLFPTLGRVLHLPNLTSNSPLSTHFTHLTTTCVSMLNVTLMVKISDDTFGNWL